MALAAHWIWLDDDPLARNVLGQFRRAFTLDAPPAAAQLHISADSRYLLHVNGERIGYGPARAYHFHYEYDTYDLAPYLRAGSNVIAVEVSHWGEGTFHQQVGRAGLLVQLDLDGQPHLLSGGDWKAKRSLAHRQAVPRIACQMAWEEQVDARLADVGWTEPGFDDSDWPAAVVAGPVGMAPWGELSPRAIPFLTDEPMTPIRGWPLGQARRPEVVAAIHAGPYLVPGDLTSNRHILDGLIATVLRLERPGVVVLQRCSNAGGDPPVVRVDGVAVSWQAADVDVEAALSLAAGDHVVLMDWNNISHDMDFTFTARSQTEPLGLSVASPLPGDAGRWAIAVAPGPARAAAAQAANPAALLACGAAWQPVREEDTPEADVYMAITASVLTPTPSRGLRLPLRVPPAPPGHAHHYMFDFGRLAIGWLDFEIEAEAGTVVDLFPFEAYQEGRPQLTPWLNNTLRYVCRAGRQSYRSIQRRGCRYLLVVVHGAAESVLHRAELRLSTYPWSIQGAFRSSDPRLNQIWEMCVYSLRLCSEDVFTDCPTYEQVCWTGDACHADVLVHAVAHGDPRLPRRVLLLVADSLRHLPIANSQVPGDWENDLIPNWSWLWAIGCANYYQHTADAEFARQVYPALAKQSATLAASRNAAGLVELKGYWHLLDWARIPDGYDQVLAHESILGVGALEAAAVIARAAGLPAEAERWEQLAAELAAAVNTECWRPDQNAYSDVWLPGGVPPHALVTAGYGTTTAYHDSVSQPTNITALLTGVAPPERAALITPRLLDCPEDWVESGTPWMAALGGQMLAERGYLPAVLNMIRDKWGGMLDRGSTTTWELFPGFEAMGSWWTRSWCHAWATLPAYLLSSYVLGIRPLEPGFRRALIAPQLADLSWAEGRVPTPHGPINVRIERAERGQSVQVSLPAGVPAELRLPARAGQAPVVHGAAAEVRLEDGVYVVALPAGAHAAIHY
jgi:alpha-L-rhamnosidase